MPTYKVTDPTTGKTIKLTGDSPPSEQELNDVFSSVSAPNPTPASVPTAPATPQTTGQKIGNAATSAGNFLGIGALAKAPAQALATGQAVKTADKSSQQGLESNMALIKRARTLKSSGDTAGYDRIKKLILQNINGGQANATDIATNGEGYVTNKQVIGSAVNTALVATTPGGISKSIPKTLAKKSLETAAYSGVAGAATAASEDKSGKDIAKAGTVSAVIGAALPVLGEGLKKLAVKRAGSLYDKALGSNKRDVKELIRTGKKTVGQELAEKGGMEGFAKTKQGILKASQQGIDQAEKQVQNKLAGIKGTISLDDATKPLLELRDEAAGVPGREAESAVYDRMLNTAKNKFGKQGVLTAKEANRFKRSLYEDIGKAFEKPEQERAIVAKAQSKIAKGVRLALEKYDPTLGPINQEQAVHLKVREKIIDAIASGQLKDIRGSKTLPEVIAGALGLSGGLAAGIATGSTLAGLAVPAVVGTAAVAGRVASSTPVRTAEAKILSQIGTKTASPRTAALLRRLTAGQTGRTVGR